MEYNNIIYLSFAIILLAFVAIIFSKKNKEGMEPQINSGFFDSDNYLIIGPEQTPFNESVITSSVNPSCPSNTGVVNQLSNVCRRPTIDNPFMNIAATDFSVDNLPVACNANDEDIQEEIKVNFNHELFRDLEGEVFERGNSRRQFYTLPNVAIPNNQTEFANWLYRLPTSANCKEDTSACLRFSVMKNYTKYPN